MSILLKTSLLLAFVAVSSCPAAMAQKHIEDLVNRISIAGAFQFTSTLERDPRTRKVVKKVKRLEVTGQHASYQYQFRKVFEKDAEQADHVTTHEDFGEFIQVLVFNTPEARKVYRLTNNQGRALVLLVTEIK